MLNLPQIGFHDVKPLGLSSLQVSEDADDALGIRAYEHTLKPVAFKRFVDNTIEAIDEELVLGF